MILAMSRPMQLAIVVEDNPITAQALAGYLQKAFCGIEVTLCASLAEARSRLARQQPDIVLLDIGLPDGKGIELFEEGSLRGVPWVVISTIFDDDEHLFTALRAGAQGYLLKDETDE